MYLSSFCSYYAIFLFFNLQKNPSTYPVLISFLKRTYHLTHQNENRMTLLSTLDDSRVLFTGPCKMLSLGSLHLGESFASDVSVGGGSGG